jgi:outer membrane biosynthesis protein TonB
MAYYLIDFENVKSRGMEGVELLTEEDTVCIFYSDNADSMTFDLHRKLNETKANIIYHKVAVGTKNALDFQLATYLGYLICEQQREGIHPNYFIVTKDNGFTSLMVYWKAQGVPVRIIRNLLWGKNPVAEQNLLTEEENETETVVTTAEDVAEQPQPAQPEPTQPEPVEETQEPVQPEPEKADAPEEPAEPETVDESAQPVKKPSRKKSNTRKKSVAKTDDKTAEKKAAEKKPAEKKPAEEPDELTLAVEKVLTDQTIVPQVVKFIRQYKTKQGINNALNKEFKDSKRTSEIYSAIKPLIADKKGK